MMNRQNDLTGTTASQSLAITRNYNVARELTIADLWSVLLRRRTTVVVILLFFVTAGALVCIFSTRRYEATAELQVEKEMPSPLGLQGTLGEETGSSDALQDNVSLQTQAEILQSDSLALNVIKKLNLEATPDFQHKSNVIETILDFFTPDGPPDPEQATLENAPQRRARVLKVFHKRLKVKPVAGTRLIEVSYFNPDPVVAADIVNTVSQGLIECNFQIRHSATSKTAQWLSGQLGDLRHQSENLQARVAQAQRDSGVLSLGGVDSLGREQLYSNVLDKLQQSTTAYTQAESGRIFKQAIYEITKTGDPEAISGLAGNPMFAGSNGLESSLTLIQSLHMQEAEVQAQIAALAAKFGPAYPKLAEMQSKLNATQEAIRAEVKRIADRAQNDYQVAHQVEENTHNVYLAQKRQADSLNDKTMAYTILRQEADQSRALYEGLFLQMKQAGVLADFHSNNIAVVDPAHIPAKPARPMVPIYMLASVCCGLLFGSCGAYLRDGMDRKIQSFSELETGLDRSAFGVLPFYKASTRHAVDGAASKLPALGKQMHFGLRIARRRNQELLLNESSCEPKRVFSSGPAAEFPALGDTRSCYVESLRALRTSLLLSRGGAPPKVILVTSSIAGEGKTMLSLNLAALLALQQKQVLLIDADMRKSMLQLPLGVDGNGGLSLFLAGHGGKDHSASAIVPFEKVPGLHVLPAGPAPPYPAELLGSEQMRNGLKAWCEHFDFIIIDGPPALAVTDSVILSTMADFTLLVSRYKMTERHSLDRSFRTLQAQTGSNKVGIVLNAVRNYDSAYYSYDRHTGPALDRWPQAT